MLLCGVLIGVFDAARLPVKRLFWRSHDVILPVIWGRVCAICNGEGDNAELIRLRYTGGRRSP